MNNPHHASVGISATVGDTPLVQCQHLLSRREVDVFAKLESFNPGGSAKDRTARALLAAGLSSGLVGRDSVVVESSSGNLGIALARECAQKNIDFLCVVDPRTNARTVAIIEALGAQVVQVTEPDPDTGDWLVARRNKVADILRENPRAVNLDQYGNTAAFDAHTITMGEIIEQLGKAPDYLFVAMSTTGTIGGCLKKLSQVGAHTRVVGVDAEGSVLFGGTRGQRLLPGYGAGMVPHLSTLITPDDILRITAAHAIAGARHFAAREGYLPGASGGAVVAALLEMEQEFPPGSTVAFIVHDGGEGYVDTVYNDAWVKENV